MSTIWIILPFERDDGKDMVELEDARETIWIFFNELKTITLYL